MAMTKKDRYTAARREIEIRLEKGGDLIADLGNITAVLKKRLQYYWIGFYFVQDDRLVLGPFQGTPACVFLSCEQGVCAAAAIRKDALIVPDVNAFPGHIACDPNSQSEIVIPCFDAEGNVRAVLDVDHNLKNIFDDVDRVGLQSVTELLKSRWK